MSSAIIGTLLRVHRLGRAMHPALNLNSVKHQLLLLWHGLLFNRPIRDWFEMADNPLLKRALLRFPLMSGAIYWPYINHGWPMQLRLGVIAQHYRMLHGPAALIAHATFEETEIAALDAEYSGLRLVLDKAVWFLREGEIVLNLFVGEQRIYSLAFTLSQDAGQPVLLLGALQGSNTEAAQETYRKLTHALHGLRPRDLLLTALRLLCAELGIRRILAISSEMRQHNSPYFGGGHRHQVLLGYNEVWQEQGGHALDNGFYEIPASVSYRAMEEIPSRKRASYRRRYQMLDGLAQQIGASCKQHAAADLPPVRINL